MKKYLLLPLLLLGLFVCSNKEIYSHDGYAPRRDKSYDTIRKYVKAQSNE